MVEVEVDVVVVVAVATVVTAASIFIYLASYIIASSQLCIIEIIVYLFEGVVTFFINAMSLRCRIKCSRQRAQSICTRIITEIVKYCFAIGVFCASDLSSY